jgi:solute carrier family 24 (sodium/potassium/calcium exchanger), member 6
MILASIAPAPEEIDPLQTLTPSATPLDRRSPTRPRAKSQPGPPRIQTDFSRRSSTIRGNHPGTRSTSPTLNYSTYRRSRTTSHQMPSFSLIGALEFRQVVASLASQAAGDPLNLHIYQESPWTPYVRGYYPHHHSHSSTSRPRTPDQNQDPWDSVEGSVQLHECSSSIPPSASGVRLDQMIFPSNPASETDAASHQLTPPSKPQKMKHVLYRIWHVLFPTLHHFWGKTIVGKIVALFAAPAVVALTITLPVVVTPFMAGNSVEKLPAAVAGTSDPRLIDFEEEGVEVERALIAEEETSEELRELKYNKWLMATQCIFGPLWCVAVLFGESFPV